MVCNIYEKELKVNRCAQSGEMEFKSFYGSLSAFNVLCVKRNDGVRELAHQVNNQARFLSLSPESGLQQLYSTAAF